MSELEKIPIRIHIRGDAFVSAQNLESIIYSVNEAALEVEYHELNIIREEFNDIPDYIFDSVELNLQRKSGSTLLIQEAHSGSIVLGGVIAGLTIWLLNITIGTTIKEAWKESGMHQKLKEFLLKKIGTKSQVIGENIKSKLEENGIETGIEATDESIDVYVSQNEDDDISSDIKGKRIDRD